MGPPLIYDGLLLHREGNAVRKTVARTAESVRTANDRFSIRSRVRRILLLILGLPLGSQLVAQDSSSHLAQSAFPDTDRLISRVAQHQKQVEALLDQYTCTYKTPVYTLDKAGSIRSQHTDIYYITPTPYEVFMLHINHDGKPTSQENLQRQENEIQHKLQSYERKAQQNPDVRPKAALLFADIIGKSQFRPLGREEVNGTPTVAYSFAPKSQPVRRGSNDEKIASDMKGTMWIDLEDAEVVRMEFSSAAPLDLSLFVNVKNFQGFIEQRKVSGEIWLPSHQELVARGRELIKGFRIRQVSEFTDYLKATTDVFQQIHASNAVAGDNTKPPH
jgi:hypothetical protein